MASSRKNYMPTALQVNKKVCKRSVPCVFYLANIFQLIIHRFNDSRYIFPYGRISEIIPRAKVCVATIRHNDYRIQGEEIWFVDVYIHRTGNNVSDSSSRSNEMILR